MTSFAVKGSVAGGLCVDKVIICLPEWTGSLPRPLQRALTCLFEDVDLKERSRVEGLEPEDALEEEWPDVAELEMQKEHEREAKDELRCLALELAKIV